MIGFHPDSIIPINGVFVKCFFLLEKITFFLGDPKEYVNKQKIKDWLVILRKRLFNNPR